MTIAIITVTPTYMTTAQTFFPFLVGRTDKIALSLKARLIT